MYKYKEEHERKLEALRDQYHAKQMRQEMEECTFSPKISKQDRNGVKGPRRSFDNFARNEE